VQIKKGAASKVTGDALAEDYKWDFTTPRPQLKESRPEDKSKWVGPDAVLFANFTMPVNGVVASKYIELAETGPQGDSMVPVSSRNATKEEIKKAWGDYVDYEQGYSSATVLAITPKRALRKDCSYKLIFKTGLPATTGNLGTADDSTVNFRALNTFAFRGSQPPACLPGELKIAFSNPVRYTDILDNMSVSPSTNIARPQDNWRLESTGYEENEDGLRWHAVADFGFKPGQSYTIKISGGLKDSFGNALGHDETLSVTVPDYCQRMSMSGGFGILESYLKPRHPVNAINTFSTPLIKKRLTDEQIIPVYSKITTSSSDEPALPGLAPADWKPNLGKNISVHTFADLSPVLQKGQGGTVLLQLPNQHISALDNVTRVGILFKTSPSQSLIWTSYLKTAAPAINMPVEIRGDNNKVLWRGRTDREGFAIAPGWAALGIKNKSRWQRPRLWVFAKDPAGTAVLASDFHGGVDPWRFNINNDYAPSADKYGGFMYTERGVYRPGETVDLKAVLRKVMNGDWKYPGVKTLELSIHDASGDEVFNATVPVSELGSFDYSYQLRDDARTGDWSAYAALPSVKKHSAQDAGCSGEDEEDCADEGYSGGRERDIPLSAAFRVEAFKPALFEVHLTPDATSYFPGDTFKAYQESSYLYGAPLADAQAQWTLRFERGYVDFPAFEGYSFGASEDAQVQLPAALSGESTLDALGKTAISTELPQSSFNFPLRAVLEASVTSPERQRLFARTSAVINPAAVYPGIKLDGSDLAEVGSSITATMIGAGYDGTLAVGTTVECELLRHDYMSVQRAGVAGRLEWVSEERDVPVSTFTFVTSTAPYHWTFSPDKPGNYRLTASAGDAKNRNAASRVWFYVAGPGEAWWKRSDNDIIELKADKSSYKPGDTARIMIKSPYERSLAVVTIEREGVMEHRLERLQGNAPFITVPITDAHVPNIFVGVALIQGRTADNKFDDDGMDLGKPQSKFGYVELPVDPGGRKMSVKVSTDKTEYRPGGEVSVSLKTLAADGKPVPAEVSLAVVDEGVLALTAYSTPDPFAPFYGSRALQIWTADSRLFVIGERNFGEKGENRGGGGGGGALSLAGVDLRSRFVPTAYWNPSVKTGPDGMATVKFSLPSNITRFRVMAVAHTERQFGSASSVFTTKKPLLLRASLPRFARLGDKFGGGVIVSNYTGSASTVTITVQPSGDALRLGRDWQRSVYLEQGKSAEVSWDMEAARFGTAKLAFRAAAGNETDGLQWQFPVGGVERVETNATSGVTATSALESVAMPKNSAGDAAVEAAMSPSALARLRESVRFLAEYPYGCLEQKISSVMPAIAGGELAGEFGLGDMNHWRPIAQKVIDAAPGYQHSSGGYSYWPERNAPDPYLTAYVLEALAIAKREGYKVDSSSTDKAVNWLANWVGDDNKNWAYPYSRSEEYAARAYAVYALTLYGDPLPGVFSKLYDARAQMPLEGRAWLLKAAPYMSGEDASSTLLAHFKKHKKQQQDAEVVLKNPDEAASALAGELMSAAARAPQTMHFEDPATDGATWLHESAAKTTAACLDALLSSGKGFPGDEKVVAWLLAEQKAKGRWRTTYENAMVLRALTDFYRTYEKGSGTFSAYLRSGSGGAQKALWTGEFVKRNPPSVVYRAALKELLYGTDDSAKLMFSKSGEGRLYYSLALKYTPMSFAQKDWQGFEIEKNITPLKPSDEKMLHAPERAIVTLTVRTNQDRTFVALTDRLPAGFEVVDPSFAVESANDSAALDKTRTGDWWEGFSRHEYYDDEVRAFADYLPAGTYTYSYLVQATTPGAYALPAAYVEQMYEPEVFGRTASGNIEIR